MADQDPAIRKIKIIPVGTVVLYHGRVGSMRQGRTEFPAVVLKQHPDDGTLDLLVWFEAEDQIWEQRVQPWTEANPGHSWSYVGRPEDMAEEDIEVFNAVSDLDASLKNAFNILDTQLKALVKQMYGDWNAPDKSMIEYLNDFDERLTALERKYRSG